MEILNNQFLFNAHGPNPYDIVIGLEELPFQIQKEINEIEIKKTEY